jgi:hypothetical protein
MTQGFEGRAFIDHYNLRHATSYVDSNPKSEMEVKAEADRIKANCRHAADLGMNSYVLFSRCFEDLLPYDFLPPLWSKQDPLYQHAQFLRRTLRDVLEFGSSLGLKMVFHANQFAFPQAVYEHYGNEMKGTAAVCPAKPKTWELFRGKIDWFLREFSGCGAFQLTTSETQVSIFQCECDACSSMSPMQRSVRMVEEAASVCRSHGKELQIRTWGKIKDPITYPEFSAQLPDRVTVSTKNTAGDFHLGSPFNPLAGQGKAPQIVEFDAWREYTDWNHFPCYMGDIFAERLRSCAQNDIHGVACRVNWNPGEDDIFEIPFGNVANIRVFAGLARDPWINPDDVLLAWIRQTFPTGDDLALLGFYKNTLRVQRASLYFLGEHAASHSSVFYNLGSRDYQARMERLMGQDTLARTVRRPELLDRRSADLERVWSATFQEIDGLGKSMPIEWHADLILRGQNLRSLARVNTVCLRLYVDMVRADKPPFPLDRLEAELAQELSAWRERDEEDHLRRRGDVAREILAEARAKVGR